MPNQNLLEESETAVRTSRRSTSILANENKVKAINSLAHSTKVVNLSIVVPLYNESARVHLLRAGVLDFIAENKRLNFELILVNDGSSDDTKELIGEMAKELNALGDRHHFGSYCINLAENAGKGEALRRGVSAALGTWVLTIDADMATPISQISDWIAAGAFDPTEPKRNIYIGNRRNDDTTNSLLRTAMSLTFSFLTRTILNLRQTDTQCGFKLYPQQVAQACFHNLNERGWSHDVEVLSKIAAKGIESVEVPVNWHEVSGSKVSPVNDSIKMFIGLFRVRLHTARFVARNKYLSKGLIGNA